MVTCKIPNALPTPTDEFVLRCRPTKLFAHVRQRSIGNMKLQVTPEMCARVLIDAGAPVGQL